MFAGGGDCAPRRLVRRVREFGSSGRVFTKSEAVTELAAGATVAIEAQGFAAGEPAPGVVLLMYRTIADGIEALHSSIWAEAEDGWKMVFHQGTRVPPVGAEG